MQYVLFLDQKKFSHASGEQKLMTMSGEKDSIFLVILFVLSMLASSFIFFSFPPYFPTKIGLKLRIFASFETSVYFLEVHKISCFLPNFSIICSENSNCFGVRISIHIFK